MSKSKGNVVTPMHLLEEYGADAVRYWAASGRPGTDTAFDVKQMKVGRRLAVKLLNASKFALADLPPQGESLTHPLDRAMIARLAGGRRGGDRAASRTTTTRVRSSAWRTSSGGTATSTSSSSRAAATTPTRRSSASVSRALRLSLSVFQRLFAPFLPFVCEEVWSWWQEGSVHRAPGPTPTSCGGLGPADDAARAGRWRACPAGDGAGGDRRRAEGGAQGQVRGAPCRCAHRSRAWSCATAPSACARSSWDPSDLLQAGSIEALEPVEAEEFAVEVELAEEAPSRRPRAARDGSHSSDRVPA